MYSSQIVTGVILFLYIVGCAILILFLYLRNADISPHGVVSIIGICFVGVAILLYRLFRGKCTRRVKYYHLILNSVALIAFVVGVIIVQRGNIFKGPVHTFPSIVLLILFLIQYVMAVFIFTYLYEHRQMRMYWAPIHDILGIWLFLCLVGILLLGINVDNSEKIDDTVYTNILNSIVYTIFLMVIFVVLCPFFEWEMVGVI